MICIHNFTLNAWKILTCKTFPELQTKIAVYQKEVEASEQEILQLKEKFENEMCVFRNQIDKVQRKLSDCEMECERLKKELNAAQQQKAKLEKKAQEPGNKVKMFIKKRGNYSCMLIQCRLFY